VFASSTTSATEVFLGIKKLAIIIGTSAGKACAGSSFQVTLRLVGRDPGRV
jgi:hypothetical protein